MRIIHKGIALVSILLLSELVFIIAVFWNVERLGEVIEEQTEYSRVTHIVREVDVKAKRFCVSVVTSVVNKEPEAYKEGLKELDAVSAGIESANEILKKNPRYSKITVELSENWHSMRTIFVGCRRLFDKSANVPPTDQALMMAEFQDKFTINEQHLNDILSEYNVKAEEALKETRSSRNNLYLTLVIGVLFNVFMAVCSLVYFSRDFGRRIDKIVDNSLRLAAGQPLTEPGQGSDEIASLDRVLHGVGIALRQSEERERAIFEHAVDIICALDEVGQITKVNRAFESRLGYSRENVVDKNIAEFLVDEDRVHFQDFLGMARVAEEMSHHTEKRMCTIDGDIRHMEWSAKWDGAQASYFCVLHDITGRKELEQAKQEFLSMVSHDLRSPLTSIRVSLGMFLSGVFGDMNEKGAKRLQAMDLSVDRLIRLINDLLDAEKLDAGKFNLSVKPARTAELVKASVEAVQGMADSNSVELKVTGSNLDVRVDSDRIVQVLNNLLSNAIKFSPPKSSVEVRTTLRDDVAEIRVIDQGKGISSVMHNQLFNRFKQVDAHGEIEKKGTGLGLSISKAIIEAHGGTIGLDSEIGQGSQFWFRIPLS